MMSVDWGFLQMAEVRKFVKDTIMMAGDRTTVTVPAGIFANADMANMMMVGYGPGRYPADSEDSDQSFSEPHARRQGHADAGSGGRRSPSVGQDS